MAVFVKYEPIRGSPSLNLLEVDAKEDAAKDKSYNRGKDYTEEGG